MSTLRLSAFPDGMGGIGGTNAVAPMKNGLLILCHLPEMLVAHGGTSMPPVQADWVWSRPVKSAQLPCMTRLFHVPVGRLRTCRVGAFIMADIHTASAPGRTTLRVCAQLSLRPSAPVSEYARAYMLCLARRLAERNVARRALRRVELRARTFELVAADRMNRGGAA